MRRLFFALAGFFAALCMAIYAHLTRKAYYVTGTFLLNGERLFFRASFETHGNIMPIASLEKYLAGQYGADHSRLVILNFVRIPFSMIKYISAEYEDNFFND